jgi:DNA polymerase, archaea type
VIEGLKSRYRVEECIFNVIFGKFEGNKILAIRKLAEKIEVQIRYAAQSGILTYYPQW